MSKKEILNQVPNSQETTTFSVKEIKNPAFGSIIQGVREKVRELPEKEKISLLNTREIQKIKASLILPVQNMEAKRDQNLDMIFRQIKGLLNQGNLPEAFEEMIKLDVQKICQPNQILTWLTLSLEIILKSMHDDEKFYLLNKAKILEKYFGDPRLDQLNLQNMLAGTYFQAFKVTDKVDCLVQAKKICDQILAQNPTETSALTLIAKIKDQEKQRKTPNGSQILSFENGNVLKREKGKGGFLPKFSKKFTRRKEHNKPEEIDLPHCFSTSTQNSIWNGLGARVPYYSGGRMSGKRR